MDEDSIEWIGKLEKWWKINQEQQEGEVLYWGWDSKFMEIGEMCKYYNWNV